VELAMRQSLDDVIDRRGSDVDAGPLFDQRKVIEVKGT
jgi:hypothetical protein